MIFYTDVLIGIPSCEVCNIGLSECVYLYIYEREVTIYEGFTLSAFYCI